jgi:hypothetical protein
VLIVRVIMFAVMMMLCDKLFTPTDRLAGYNAVVITINCLMVFFLHPYIIAAVAWQMLLMFVLMVRLLPDPSQQYHSTPITVD